VGDEHDSTYVLGLEATRKATVTSMQAAGIASKLMWIYWHHDPDSQWFGNWVLLHVTPNTKEGMTRAMVHEVMHDTTVVKAKDSTSRMPPNERTAKYKCVHLGNVAAIARTKTVVFVSPKPMVFHGCGRGGVWDLTSHITCMASRPGPAGTDAQEGSQLRFNSVGRPVQVYLPPPTYQDALSFIVQHLTPIAHEQAEMPHDKQDELLLRCGIRAQGPLDVVMLNEIECDVTMPSGEHWVGRHVYKWFPGNEELDNKITWNGTVTTYSKLAIITEQGYQSDEFHVVFADADDCDTDEESMRRLLCSSGTLDGVRSLINRDAWDLAIYLHAVSDTKQYQGMGMECSTAPIVCPCLFGKDCTLTREGTILAAADIYNRAVAEVSGGATPDSWSGVAT